MLPYVVNDAQLAIRVVSAGAEQVHQRFRTPMRRIDKGSGDFATDVDLLAESAMPHCFVAPAPPIASSGRSPGTAVLRRARGCGCLTRCVER
jgi:myo-inositol-1(or 4)-monophosphatase